MAVLRIALKMELSWGASDNVGVSHVRLTQISPIAASWNMGRPHRQQLPIFGLMEPASPFKSRIRALMPVGLRTGKRPNQPRGSRIAFRVRSQICNQLHSGEPALMTRARTGRCSSRSQG
jgi:hypothetical protein